MDNMQPVEIYWVLEAFLHDSDELAVRYRLEGINDEQVLEILRLPRDTEIVEGYLIQDQRILDRLRSYLPKEASLPDADYFISQEARYNWPKPDFSTRKIVLRGYFEEDDRVERVMLVGANFEDMIRMFEEVPGYIELEAQKDRDMIKEFLPSDFRFMADNYSLEAFSPPPEDGLMLLKGYKIADDSSLQLYEQYQLSGSTIESICEIYEIKRAELFPDGYRLKSQVDLNKLVDLIPMGQELTSDFYWVEHLPTRGDELGPPRAGRLRFGPTRKEEIDERHRLRSKEDVPSPKGP